MVIFLALVALCLFGTSLAGESSDSGCPAVTGQANFDFNRYTGIWHPNAMYYPQLPHAEWLKCSSTDYSIDENDSIHSISHYTLPQNGERQKIVMDVIIPDPNEPSKLQIVYPTNLELKFDLVVLATDYDSYAVGQTCAKNNGTVYQSMWIATRERHPSAEVIDTAATELEKYGVSRTELLPVDQFNC